MHTYLICAITKKSNHALWQRGRGEWSAGRLRLTFPEEPEQQMNKSDRGRPAIDYPACGHVFSRHPTRPGRRMNSLLWRCHKPLAVLSSSWFRLARGMFFNADRRTRTRCPRHLPTCVLGINLPLPNYLAGELDFRNRVMAMSTSISNGYPITSVALKIR